MCDRHVAWSLRHDVRVHGGQCKTSRAAPSPAVIRASIRPSTYFTVSFLDCSIAAFKELTSLSTCISNAE